MAPTAPPPADPPAPTAVADQTVRPPASKAHSARPTPSTSNAPTAAKACSAGEAAPRVHLSGGRVLHTALAQPPGSPLRVPSAGDLHAKSAACGTDVPALLDGIGWDFAPALLHDAFPGTSPA